MQPIHSIERIVYRSELVTIGEFRCPRGHALFEDSGPIENDCFVFPRSAVTIEHEHERAFVANPNVVTLYNRGQRYRRGPISRQGDRSDWFALDGALLREVVRRHDPSVDDRPGPFVPTRARSEADLYLRQRQLFELASSPAPDALAIEEGALGLLESLLAPIDARPVPTPARRARRSALVHHLEGLLSARFEEDLRLGDLAREVGLSVHHLCHAFRRETGSTLHQYRHQLRLRTAVEVLRRKQRPLVELAIGLGFANHSHFASAFRRTFGVTPSAWRAGAGPRDLPARAG